MTLDPERPKVIVNGEEVTDEAELDAVIYALGNENQRLHAEIERLGSEVVTLTARVDDYENSINWNTDCLSCPKLLDKSYKDYHTIENLQAALARVTALCDEWATKAEGTPMRAFVPVDVLRAAVGTT